MAERFKQLYKLPCNLYITGAPIIISAGVLLLDTETANIIAQLKFQSVSEKTIRAVKVSLSAYDVSEKPLQDIDDYQYLDLRITSGQYFGHQKALVFSDPNTRSFGIKNITIVFADKTCWEWDIVVPMEILPAQQVLRACLGNDELVKQYCLNTNEQAKFVPAECKDLWICACGEANKGEYCTKCNLRRSEAFETLDIAALRDLSTKRLKTENARKDDLRAENEKVLKKKRLASIVLGVSITLFSGFFITFGTIPNWYSDGFTMRVANLAIWTLCALAFGVIFLLEASKGTRWKKAHVNLAKFALLGVGIIAFLAFYVMTYL